MRRISNSLAILATFLLAGCAKPTPDLLKEAHGAAAALLPEMSLAAFDDASTQVFPEKGLVCGSKISIRSGSGEQVGYQRYYFSRSSGAALEGTSPSWLPLANTCIAAMIDRVSATDHRLGLEKGGT
jgi:hypothetical protein